VRVSVATLVALGAIAALVALGVTDQVLPATDPRTEQIRPWVAARAFGVTAYLLLAVEVATGLILSFLAGVMVGRGVDSGSGEVQAKSATQVQEEILEGERAYFKKNKERMRYEDFRKQGLFVGSGVVEAGYRTVIGQRLKQPGMHWTVKGANRIIALRCCILSNRWEAFWEYRAST